MYKNILQPLPYGGIKGFPPRIGGAWPLAYLACMPYVTNKGCVFITIGADPSEQMRIGVTNLITCNIMFPTRLFNVSQGILY